MSAITHCGARTRTLYLFEEREILVRDENHGISLDAARYLTKRTWERYGCQRPMPSVTWGRRPICWGYGYIELGIENDNISTMLHELCHARGYGSRRKSWNVHSVGFVEAYIEMLAWWFRWCYEELITLARCYKLV